MKYNMELLLTGITIRVYRAKLIREGVMNVIPDPQRDRIIFLNFLYTYLKCTILKKRNFELIMFFCCNVF